MLKDYKNKMVEADDTKTKTEPTVEPYHFAGGGEYQPLTVYAASREEAEKVWEQKRVKVEPTQKLEPEIKTE